MNRVVHFEIHAKDTAKIKKFYQDVFGWTMQQMGPEMGSYIVVQTGPAMPSNDPATLGINGGITTRMGDVPKGGEPVNAFVCIIGVDDTVSYMDKIQKAGGSMALDKMEVPGVGLLAYMKDPEGSIFGILQPSPEMSAQK
jgi:predicted enzyme related to lactoylglutathione lyase